MAEVKDPVDGWNSVCNSIPTINELQSIVTPKVAARWYQLGISLYDNSDVPRLDIIKAGTFYDITVACNEMLKSWVELYRNRATWRKLVLALQSPALVMNAQAHYVMKEVVQGYHAGQAGEQLTKGPTIRELKNIVVPEVKAEWESLAISMDYKTSEIKAIRKNGDDVEERCLKLFEDWLETPHGCTPKTWEVLLERIEEVDRLHASAERIRKKLPGQ